MFVRLDENHTLLCMIFIQSAFGRVKFLCSQGLLTYLCIINQRHLNMNMILHNLKVAIRNLMKYKLQTAISVLSIAVGILTISLAHSYLCNFKLNALYDLPFIERTYNVTFKSVISGENMDINGDIVRALKKNDALKSAEQVVLPLSGMYGVLAEFNLPDSTVRKGSLSAESIDPDFLRFAGFRSAITGKPITELKKGQAIIGETLAKRIFQDKSPLGSVQEETGPVQTIPVRIVDVYKSMHMEGSYSRGARNINDELLFSLADRIEDQDHDLFFLLPWINIVRKEGSSEQSLIKEINELVLPFGVEARIEKTYNKEGVRFHYAYKAFIYALSSLILLAAIIGYLRTQIQLFNMRRGELSLRIVNGAHRRELWTMLVTEPIIVIALSVFLAISFGFPIQEFLQSNIMLLRVKIQEITISHLWLYSIEIGACLLLFVFFLAWLVLNRVCNSTNSLAVNMRRSRSHMFRNVMLGFQIAVSLVFVCSTLILMNTGRNMLKQCNIPEKDDLYSDCLLLRSDLIRDEERSKRVCDEIARLPEVDRVEMYMPNSSFDILEIKNSPEALEKMGGLSHFQCTQTIDKDLPSLLGMEVEWLPGDVDRNECLLIGEDLYRRLKDTSVLNGNTLSSYCGGPRMMISLPIGGIIKNIPYTTELDQIVAITQYWKENYMNMTHIVIPKYGKGRNLDKKIFRILSTTDPENINNDYMINNYRNLINWIPQAVRAVYVGCIVLGSISLLICAMGIYSAIALDTRGRRKEVAIRKVNGAKDRNIYRMFGRLYIILIVVALIIAIPVCVFFSRNTSELQIGSISSSVSIYYPIILGSMIVTALILLLVYWQIREVLNTDTSKIISKE